MQSGEDLQVSRNGAGGDPWWITIVYGPQSDGDKELFLDSLVAVRAVCPGPWLLSGDFNMIYQASDKNNGRLNRRCMRRFRGFISRMGLDEIHLSGRRYTWSNR